MGSILIVEADPDTCSDWVRAIEAAGHVVTAARSMRETLPLIREGGIDAVVLDAYDPRAGVVELARSIEALPDGPPLILVSGSPHAPEISARIGAAAFITKPCDTADLIAAVNRLLGELRPVRVVGDEPTGPTRHL